MRKEKIPTIIGLIVLIMGIAVGVFLTKNQQIFRLGASSETSPQDIRISNISDSTFTVNWTTEKETLGFVKWGKNKNNLDKVESDSISEKGYTHSISIRSLNPETEYFFSINSNSKDFDNEGTPWIVKTGPKLSEPTTNIIISGTVLSQSGKSIEDALIYFTVGGGTLLSTVTSKNGGWLIPISYTRNKALTSYISINESSTLVEISVNAGVEGLVSAQIYPRSAKPAPAVIIGETNDFRNATPSENTDLPSASIEIPEGETSTESGFKIPDEQEIQSTNTVTLESLDEGEILSTQDPEFFGKGPKGTDVEILVESEIQTDTVTVGNSGNWSWSPSEKLEEGVHKITIKWRDENGILRTLTRNFIVQASESPAFVSTPSASPTQTPTASPTATPKSSFTASPTATPKQPVSGSLTQTLLLFMMGIATISFSLVLWRNTEI